MLIGAIVAAVIAIAMSIYSYVQMRKMQKKNRPKPSQIDGTLADEGTSFMDIAGSPHMHGNIVEFISKQADPIKKKSGGFLGIGSSSQVVGYRYYTTFVMFIGNYVEDLIHIIFGDADFKLKGTRVPVGNYGTLFYMTSKLSTSIYGEQEGGIGGVIRLMHGDKDQYPDPILQETALIRGDIPEDGFYCSYPYQSYLVFSGGTLNIPSEDITEEELQQMADEMNNGVIPGRGFYIGNSNYMKEMLLCVKRIHVKNNGDVQWYDLKSEISYKYEYEISENYLYKGPFYLEAKAVVSSAGGINEVTENNYTYTGDFKQSDTFGAVWSIGGQIESIEPHNPLSFEAIYSVPSLGFIAEVYFTVGREGVSSQEVEYSVVGVVVEPIVVTISGNSTYISAKFLIPKGEEKTFIGLKGVASGIVLGSGSPQIGAKIITNMHKCYKLKSFIDYDGEDINPIHKIREILSDDTAMGKPESEINNVNFMKAADRIWDEGLGISWAIEEKSCIDAIDELCYHIEAGIRVNRQTGLYEMVLFRDDWFTEDEIHTIAENKIKDLSLEVMNSDDIVNQLNVTYYDRKRIKNSTFSVYENGSILTMGKANAESIDFPYFMNMRNAEIVANWKLKQYSTPAWKGTFTTGWREARKWNRYDLVKINWSKKWQGTILARIMKIDLGNGLNNEVMIDFEEVVPYSGEMNTSIVVDAPIESAPQPPQPSINTVFEMPYYLTVLRAGQTNADLELSNNPDIGYVAAIAAKPQNNSLNALLYTDGGIGEFEQVSRLDYCDILQLDQPINETASAFVVTGSLTQTANSNNFILLNDELMGFVSFDDATKVLTVKRGVLDTIPKKHNSGNLFVFDLPDVAFDSTQYAQSEVVDAQVLTTTPSGIQELSTTGTAVEIQARAIRPYPPANVKIDNAYYPFEVSGASMVLAWVDRNRVQQTGGDTLGYFDAGVTIESGVTYQVEVYEIDASNAETLMLSMNVGAVNTYTVDLSATLPTTKKYRIRLYSVRDTYESYQAFEHVINTAFSAPYNLAGVYTP